MEFNREFFDAGIYRVGTQSTKWDGIRKDCGKDDIVPLWVADMDFPSPPAVQREFAVKDVTAGRCFRSNRIYSKSSKVEKED